MNNHDNRYLSSLQAADYLGYKNRTMIQSRYTGVLGGVKAPSHTKRGTRTYYQVSVLNEWVSQFGNSCAQENSGAQL